VAITAAPRSQTVLAIAVPLRDGPRVLGALNMLWMRPAHTVEAFANRFLPDLQTAAAEIVDSLRKRSRHGKA